MRKMVTVRQVHKIEPIEGADLIELAHVDGWSVITKLGDILVKAEGEGMNDGVIREGIVVKSCKNSFSFKAISNHYLLNVKG